MWSTIALPGKVRASNIFWDLILILLYAVVLMVVLRATLRVDLTSLLATSAVISVIIGFALQETLGNIFAGLAMQMQKPFEPGDWIHFGTHLGRVQGSDGARPGSSPAKMNGWKSPTT